MIESGTILIRDGRIQEVGKNLKIPADARVWDSKGLIIYAGFIDPYVLQAGSNAPVATADVEPVDSSAMTAGGTRFFGVPKPPDAGLGPGYEVARITPQTRAVTSWTHSEKQLERLRGLGFTAGNIVPAKGIIRGTTALVGFGADQPNQAVLKPEVFQAVAFELPGGEDRTYPGALMGVIAVIRQSFLDARYYALDQADFARRPGSRQRPEYNPALEALLPAANRKMGVVFEPGSALMADRVSHLARELELEAVIVSSGQEWRRPDLAKATGAAFIVPINFPSVPKLPAAGDWDQVSLDTLRAWDWAPENPALLRQQGLSIALTTHGVQDNQKFRENLRLALDRGLSETDALAALTVVPAKLCGVEASLGTIEAGKLANLTVVSGSSYFDPEAKVQEVWIEGKPFRIPSEEAKAPEKKVDTATPKTEPAPKTSEEPEKNPKPPGVGVQEAKATTATNAPAKAEVESGSRKNSGKRDLLKKRDARPPLEDRGPLASPPAVVVRNATVWTCGPQGVLTNASLLCSGTKIQAIGDARLEAPAGAVVIDGTGLHVTPGLIDCHSHTAILGAVNEGTLPSTAMARIGDVVNSETVNLQLQLAGGVTCVNLLHGSANPIGAQNCVIKLRDGASPEGLVFAAAPPGIKFALGENVKQSNWGDRYTTRFPQTRMGVGTFMVNRFTAAKQYLAEWDAFRKAQAAPGSSRDILPPRRDLELETLGEIIQGKRWIHCHAYRQDEILMLIRVMEEFGVTVGTFQHVLEGYKVADEIARHGAGASMFADWWAYKFEVYDAIPYNGSLMRERGGLVSFNSDSSELARRLNTEAAKAVKYGGTPEIDALKFVTINPAKQLRVDTFIGSLEPGKDADFAVWSKAPLDSGTVCQQTWIEGKKYFDRVHQQERANRLEAERKQLLAKARKVSPQTEKEGGAGGAAETEFFRSCLEHEFDGRDRHCMEE